MRSINRGIHVSNTLIIDGWCIPFFFFFFFVCSWARWRNSTNDTRERILGKQAPSSFYYDNNNRIGITREAGEATLYLMEKIDGT